jgi:hypothetical protein
MALLAWMLGLSSLATLVILNLKTTKAILACKASSRSERACQVFVVWTVPLMGAVFIRLVRKHALEKYEYKRSDWKNPENHFPGGSALMVILIGILGSMVSAHADATRPHCPPSTSPCAISLARAATA